MHSSGFARFNRALILWTGALLSAGGLSLWALHHVGHLPPPPLTATHCIDEKFKFLHDNPPEQPNLLAVGSSVTWRNLDFSTLEGNWPDLRPVNGAPCFLQIHQTAYLTQFYLDNMPSVRTVLSILSMQDFQNCESDGKFFDAKTARDYIFERTFPLHIYFTNFRPLSFFKDVVKIRTMRDGTRDREPLAMDRYGSGPLTFTPPEIRWDRNVTPSCLSQASIFAHELRGRGVTWTVVLLPPMPAWLRAYDPNAARDLEWRQETTAHLRGTGAIVLDGREGPAFTDSDFTDPDHLHWSSVPAFTQWIFKRLDRAGALLATTRGGTSAF
jgi:hypothetical protein